MTATHEQVSLAYDLTVQGFFLKEQNFSEAEATIRMIVSYWQKCRHPNEME